MTTKQQILDLLLQNKGEAVSGQDIAKLLGISRAAVCKAVTSIKKGGYEISSATNKGYTLCKSNDVLTQSILRQNYSLKTAAVFYEDTLPSTNTTAKALAESGAAHGSIVVAARQTGGRGRLGKTFFSPIGTGLYFSVILQKPFSMQDAGLLTAAASVCVVRVFKKLYSKNLNVKWVNDIFLNGKKCGGILTEAVTDFETGNSQYAVVGIGLNLFAPLQKFPPELNSIATAIFSQSEEANRAKLCTAIATELCTMCEHLNSKTFLSEYKDASCILGKKIEVIKKGEALTATAKTITDDCHLIVQYETGSEETLYFGEVHIKT